MFSPEDVLAIHQDTVNPAVREIVRLARHITGNLNQTLSSQAMRALDALELWNGQYNTSQQVYPLISNFNLMFRSSNTPLALFYGGGEGGLCSFAKKISHDLDVNSDYVPTEDEKNYVSGLLEDAWTKTVSDYGSNSSEWLSRYDRTIYVKYQNNLENLGSLDPRTDFTSPPLICKHTATILSQHGNSYSQNVRFDSIDLSRSLLPSGISEDPNSSFFDNQIPLWAEGELHLAPLSREIIETDAASTISLSFPPTPTPTPTESPLPTESPIPTPTDTPVPTNSPLPTGSPLPTPTESPLPTPTLELGLYIIAGVGLILASIALVVVLFLRRK